jgi:hypothetical protein
MALTQAQLSIVEKAQAVGGSKQGVALSDEACTYLVATIASDLGVADKFPEFKPSLRPFFGSESLASLVIGGLEFLPLFERLLKIDPNVDTYFACLAALHKRRLKYERILQTQPVPTIDQVGPRGLLQYGTLPAKALTPFILWRKWMFDIDNRAGQETGYVFEPIIASAIGGVSVGPRSSPVKRHGDKSKGRQVDCVRKKKAYEFKIRVTIAASGQGRWKEELDFPIDCRSSGFTPVLVVLDPTPNPKLEELTEKFKSQKGEVYVGEEAWKHLNSVAGPTMGKFIDRYVHRPIQDLLAEAKEYKEALPDMTVAMSEDVFTVSVAGEALTIERNPKPEEASEPDELPEDVEEQFPGP